MTSSKTSGGGGIDLLTLAITAVASAGAAYVTSEVWAPGTLASAAITPVLVALIKEALAKPAVVVTRAVPVRGVVRSSTPGHEPPAPPAQVDERVAQHGEIQGTSQSFGRRAWQTAIVTGLLGFLVAAVIITVPELVSGKSVTGSGGRTTLLGGDRKPATPATTTTTTTPTQTAPTETITVAPVETTTVPPAETTTLPPAETTTVPPVETTTVPPAEPDPDALAP
jgi:hypothetical protein